MINFLKLIPLKDYIFVAIAVIFLAYIGMLKIEIYNLENNNDGLRNQLLSITAVAESKQKELEEKAKEVPRTIEIVKWKTKEKIKEVKEYNYDTNKSDCTNAIDFARAYF